MVDDPDQALLPPGSPDAGSSLQATWRTALHPAAPDGAACFDVYTVQHMTRYQIRQCSSPAGAL